MRWVRRWLINAYLWVVCQRDFLQRLWNSITIKLISEPIVDELRELMKFPPVAAFHWISPRGPLTFWWPVNSAQWSRNSQQCSRKKVWMSWQKFFSVLFSWRGCCEGGLQCGVQGLKWDIVWLKLLRKHRSVKDCLWNKWNSLTWQHWHHSALIGVSDIPVKVSVSFVSLVLRKFKIPVVLGLVLLKTIFGATSFATDVAIVRDALNVNLQRQIWWRRFHFKSNLGEVLANLFPVKTRG